MEAHGGHDEGAQEAALLREEFRPDAEPILRKVGLDVHDHLSANPVRAGDAPDDRHLVPDHARASRR